MQHQAELRLIKGRLYETLRTADFQVVTEKEIRRQLSAELGLDLQPYKAYIRRHVEYVLDNMEQQATVQPLSDEETPHTGVASAPVAADGVWPVRTPGASQEPAQTHRKRKRRREQHNDLAAVSPASGAGSKQIADLVPAASAAAAAAVAATATAEVTTAAAAAEATAATEAETAAPRTAATVAVASATTASPVPAATAVPEAAPAAAATAAATEAATAANAPAPAAGAVAAAAPAASAPSTQHLSYFQTLHLTAAQCQLVLQHCTSPACLQRVCLAMSPEQHRAFEAGKANAGGLEGALASWKALRRVVAMQPHGQADAALRQCVLERAVQLKELHRSNAKG